MRKTSCFIVCLFAAFLLSAQITAVASFGLTLDGQGNIFTHYLKEDTYEAISKLSGKNGSVLWEIEPNSWSNGIFPDRRGDLFVYGFGPGNNVLITKYSGSDGLLVWEINPPLQEEDLYTITLDKNEDLIVFGIGLNGAVSITKHKGTDGALAWQISRSFNGDCWPSIGDVYLDKNGDVILFSTNPDQTAFIAKYRGENGLLAWEISHPVNGDSSCSIDSTLDFDKSANVVASGINSNGDAVIAKYRGTDGYLMWQMTRAVGSDLYPWIGDIALDKKGDVVTFGLDAGGPVFIAKYAGKDGQLTWEKTRTSWRAGEMMEIDLDKTGDVVASGLNSDGNAFVAKYKRTSGLLVWEISHGVYEDWPWLGGWYYWKRMYFDKKGDIIFFALDPDADGFIAKYRGTDGHLVWEKKGELRNMGPAHLDKNGDIIAAGSGSGGTRIEKYRGKDGALIWRKDYPY